MAFNTGNNVPTPDMMKNMGRSKGRKKSRGKSRKGGRY